MDTGRDDVTFVSNSVTCYSGFKVGMNSDPWFYLQSHHNIAVTVSWCCRKLEHLWKYKRPLCRCRSLLPLDQQFCYVNQLEQTELCSGSFVLDLCAKLSSRTDPEYAVLLHEYVAHSAAGQQKTSLREYL